jgi:histidyl-tRNA synthetase
VIQNLYENGWKQSMPKPIRVFTTSRAYRYEQPQAGRYREFTQFNIEILGPGDYESECKALACKLLDFSGVKYEFDDAVKRGLSYYTVDGFEARCEVLGAQKQIMGGGRYGQGCGFAIGIDRLMLALEKQNESR